MRRTGPGDPEPLGLALVPGGANVAVYSAHATAVELCLFDADGETERERIALPERTGDVFHGFIAGIVAGDRYGLRAHGAYDPRHGHRFNPVKLLVDPYAKALDRRFAFDYALVGGHAAEAVRDGTDSARHVPKAIAMPATGAPVVRRPRVPWADTVLYELHVRGFTRTHPGVPEAIRGTCAGLAHPAALAHLTRLGVTTVELMPIAAAIDERHLARQGLTNYWGYNPVALFVPDPRLAPGGMRELRACVASLQAAGIEVVLDIVVNHSGEGDARGPTVSLRGLDNATYYRTVAGDAARYVDDTGCGNTLALDRPPVLRLIMDALRHYAEAAGVDGFRFDLATTLGRRDAGFDPAAPLLAAIAQDPVLRDLKLIAEPWDIGPGGHRLGAFPANWGEWNDRFRDAVRRFWRGDAAQVGELATRFSGSADIFAARRRSPSRSVNFVTAHDGFTLADLVAFAGKHNEANGEGNRDGSDANYSWNHGVEGGTTDAAIVAARGRDARNLLTTLLIARGTPMLAMGDELGRSQRGNNNAYAQDSALTWIDWQNADRALTAFVASLIELRRRHPALRVDRWLAGTPVDGSGIPDVEWRLPDGRAMTAGDWTDAECRCLVALLYARGDDAAGSDRAAIALNAGNAPASVLWPHPRVGFDWCRCVDTAVPAEPPASGKPVAGPSTTVAARSVVVLVEKPDSRSRRRPSGVEPAVLNRLAAAAGIAPDWLDVAGARHIVGRETQRLLLAAMGMQVDSTDDARARLTGLADAREHRRLPAMVVARDGSPASIAVAVTDGIRHRRAELRLHGEGGTERVLPLDFDDLPRSAVRAVDGRTVDRRILALPPLRAGYYTLDVDGDASGCCRMVVAPDRCFMPPELRAGARHFGLAAHLYALRRSGDQGIGDFTTLAALAEATARAGGAVVGINPLHALFPAEPERASPYHPSDRRFLDPLYIDVERVPDLAEAPSARAVLERDSGVIAAVSAAGNVDYTAVRDVKRRVFEACFARFGKRAGADPLVVEFERFVAAGGEALRRYALFEAIAETRPREPWQRWPAELRRPDAPRAADFAARHAERLRFALYLQWLADRQLAAAARQARASGLALGYFRDLAVGAAPDGAEVWANPAAFARGVSIGAPPDSFSPGGQNWNLPPLVPDALSAAGCAGFRELLASNMRHAGALRIDHVMGLSRLYWIPDGVTAAEGAYVDYPLDALLAVLALESSRARCLVVGEDLGTVPEGLRERLASADVLSYRVLWFEREGTRFTDPSRYPATAVACVSTHDLPTIAGWWSETDIAEKRSLGLLTAAAAAAEREERLVAKQALATALDAAGVARGARLDVARPHDAEVTAAVHRFVCASPAALVLLQADDLAGEYAAANLPATDRVRPNWRRKIGVDADALWSTEPGRQAIADLAATRAAPPAAIPPADE